MTTLLAILILAQQPEPRLTYTAAALPLARICQELTPQVGKKLRVDETLAAEPLIARFTDVPSDEALAKIAEALRAEWVTSNQGMLLTRTQRLQQKLEDEEYAARLAQFEGYVEAIRKRVRGRQPFGDKEATEMALEHKRLWNLPPEQQRTLGVARQFQLLSEKSPSARFAERLMADFDPVELADSEPGATTWFSNKPNSAQRRLRDFDPAWLATFLEEHNALVQAARREDAEGLMYPPYDQEIETGDLKLLVGVSSSGLDVTIADSSGLILSRFNHGWSPTSEVIQARIDRTALQNDPSEPPIQLSQRAKDFAALYQTRQPADTKPHQVAPELREILLNPERVDPLATVLSELVFKIADGNVVAYAPDATFVWAFVAARTEPIRPSFMIASLSQGDFESTEGDGWLVLAPKFPLRVLETRIPRGILGELMRQADRDGYLSIEAIARFALSVPNEQVSLAPDYVAFLLGFAAGQQLYELDIFKLYGSLTAEQRRDLAGGETRPLSFFTGYQQELIQGLVKGSFLNFTRPTTDNPEEPREYLGMFPCESFPDGLPPDMPVKLKIQDEPGYQMGVLAGGRLSETASDFNGIAGYYAQMKRPDIFKWIPNQPLHSITPSRNFTLHLDLQPSELWMFTRFLQVNQKLGQPMSLEQFLASLTDEERAKFDEAAKKAEQGFANLPDWFTEGSNTPPPRPPR